MKGKFLLTGLAAIALGATSVYAHGGRGGFMGHLLQSADLTADQQTQIQQLLDADRPAVKDLFTQLHQAKRDLSSQLFGPQDVQADAASAQVAHIAQLQQQVEQHHVNTMLAIRKLLTADQLAKLAAAKDQKSPGRHPKHHCSEDGN